MSFLRSTTPHHEEYHLPAGTPESCVLQVFREHEALARLPREVKKISKLASDSFVSSDKIHSTFQATEILPIIGDLNFTIAFDQELSTPREFVTTVVVPSALGVNVIARTRVEGTEDSGLVLIGDVEIESSLFTSYVVVDAFLNIYKQLREGIVRLVAEKVAEIK